MKRYVYLVFRLLGEEYELISAVSTFKKGRESAKNILKLKSIISRQLNGKK